MDRLPLGVPIRAVHGRADPIVPLGQSEAFVEAARAAGDDAELAVVDGDHFVVIDPAGAAWSTVLGWLAELALITAPYVKETLDNLIGRGGIVK